MGQEDKAGQQPLRVGSGNATPARKRRTFDSHRGAHVVMLGTAGGPPAVPGRAGTATAVVVDGAVYLVDCGRGAVSAYVDAGLALAALRAIFVTHLHADHTGELLNFFLYGMHPAGVAAGALHKRVRVFGPGAADVLSPLGGPVANLIGGTDALAGTATLLAHGLAGQALHLNAAMSAGFPDVRELLAVTELVSAPGASRSLADEIGLRVGELIVPCAASSAGPTAPPMAPFVVHEDDRVRVSSILVPHGGMFPSLGYRFDTDHGSVVISGDTAESDNVVALASGCDLLIHEVMDTDALASTGTSTEFIERVLMAVHTDIRGVAAVATRAGASRLAVHHFVPADPGHVDEASWRRRLRDGYDGDVTVGRDGLQIAVGSTPSRV